MANTTPPNGGRFITKNWQWFLGLIFLMLSLSVSGAAKAASLDARVDQCETHVDCLTQELKEIRALLIETRQDVAVIKTILEREHND